VAVIDLEAVITTPSRLELWSTFIEQNGLRFVAEVGVFQGEFAEELLTRCPNITTYYMLDPWRHLDDWNKPANRDDETFERFHEEAIRRTDPWEPKRVVLRGRTTEVSESIPDAALDFAYIDADHTLRGISIDLLRIWPKVRPGGFIGGDDFCRSVWQHAENFEPTFVFPYAVYFAEAMGAPITALPHNQFLLEKVTTGFAFLDPTGAYQDTTVAGALKPLGTRGTRLRMSRLKRH
jgi:hypothetical protein